MFLYLSYENERNNWVYFDDFKVTHTKSRIVQYNEYYPFGMTTQNSWTREGATGNNLLGIGGTEWNSISSFYYLDYRNYDPILSTMNLKPAVYADGLEAENQFAMGLYGAINISLGILRKDYLGALSMINNSTQGGGSGYLNKTINSYGFVAGTFFGGIEIGFEQGVRSLESVKVVTGQAKNGAYITEYRNAVSLSNKSAYVTASKGANALKWGGRILAGGIVAYNAADLFINGGTNRDIARFALQSTISVIGFLGPIGFGVSLGLTLIEMNGGFNWVYDNFDDTVVNKFGN
jgi:hypothetical protein